MATGRALFGMMPKFFSLERIWHSEDIQRETPAVNGTKIELGHGLIIVLEMALVRQ